MADGVMVDGLWITGQVRGRDRRGRKSALRRRERFRQRPFQRPMQTRALKWAHHADCQSEEGR